MSASGEQQGGLRCRPGDLARVIFSRTPGLKGKKVVVVDWCEEYGRWQVQLLDGPQIGISIQSGRPMLSTCCYFRDSSLEPIGFPQSAADGRLESVSLR